MVLILTNVLQPATILKMQKAAMSRASGAKQPFCVYQAHLLSAAAFRGCALILI